MRKTLLQPKWREIQRQNFTQLPKLIEFLELSDIDKEKILSRPTFALNLPLRLAQKVQKGTLNDPILRQFIPLIDELVIKEGFISSPTEDLEFSKTKKLLKKYRKRALLVTTSACVMNCRFCFRQNYPYETDKKNFFDELEIIKKDSSLNEIILSGGDPLSLSDDVLTSLIDQLEQIDHLKILRFHTRFPIGIPERISKELIEILKNRRLQIVFVIHTNHPLELDDDVTYHLKELQKIGIPILNHTVLLKDVNDNLETLIDLNMKLICFGAIPYYLNQLDKVKGSSHFEVDKEKGKELIDGLRKHLPGYAVPRYIEEIPGRDFKTPIM